MNLSYNQEEFLQSIDNPSIKVQRFEGFVLIEYYQEQLTERERTKLIRDIDSKFSIVDIKSFGKLLRIKVE